MTSPSKPISREPAFAQTRKCARWSVLYFWIASAVWIFWLGGVTFYIAVVVPIGGEVIGPDIQGQVTRHVTRVINWVAIPVGCILVIHARSSQSRSFWLMTATHFVILASLFIVHRELALRMNNQSPVAFSTWSFYSVHRLYLWMTTVQWMNAVAANLLLVSSMIQGRPEN